MTCDRDLQQLDDERYERQRAEDLARKRERMQAYEERARTATTWPEALRKQASLFAREAYCGADDPIGDEFRAWQRACERALELWSEEASKIDDQRAALKKQLDALTDAIRYRVADRLETEMPEAAEDIAQALRYYSEGDGDGLSEWLHW